MLKLGAIVQGYKIASLPFESKEKAEAWIETYWKGTFAKAIESPEDGKWYIASK